MKRTCTRRAFLGCAAASVAANALGAQAPVDPFRGLLVGVQSYSFREFTTEQALQRISDLGLGYVEFYDKHIPLVSTKQQIEAVLNLCRQYRVRPYAFGVQGFTKDQDANRRVFDFGRAVGVKVFSADPTPDSFQSLDLLCEEYQIAVAIHPHGPVGNTLHRWYCAETIMAAVKDHHPLIGSCLDTGHLIRAGQLGKRLDPPDQIRLMAARNFGLHLKDHDNERRTDVVLGTGLLDVAAVAKALREVGFKGLVSLEYEANPDNPGPDLAKSLRVFSDAVTAAQPH